MLYCRVYCFLHTLKSFYFEDVLDVLINFLIDVYTKNLTFLCNWLPAARSVQSDSPVQLEEAKVITFVVMFFILGSIIGIRGVLT